jgi:hypothetical protein
MAALTGYWKLRSGMIWIGGLVVGTGMATEACIGRTVIIAIVTGCTIVGNNQMSSFKRVIIIMNRE